MNSEFSSSVEFYLNYTVLNETITKSDSSLAHSFTKAGPPAYQGPILADPNAVWLDDHLDEARLSSAQQELQMRSGKIGVSDFWRNKYIDNGGSYWDIFYKRNQSNFYKDRHYLHVVFPELDTNTNLNLLEVGCGVGNAILPLIEMNPNLKVIALDFAKSAIDLLKAHPLYKLGQISAYVHDVSSTDSTLDYCLPCQRGTMDLVLCMYVLSAISPDRHQHTLHQLVSSLKVGGRLLMRDYGRYDEAQLRFKSSSKVDDNLYVRQDGTLTYYFSKEDIATYSDAYRDGRYRLRVVENEYITRQVRVH